MSNKNWFWATIYNIKDSYAGSRVHGSEPYGPRTGLVYHWNLNWIRYPDPFINQNIKQAPNPVLYGSDPPENRIYPFASLVSHAVIKRLPLMHFNERYHLAEHSHKYTYGWYSYTSGTSCWAHLGPHGSWDMEGGGKNQSWWAQLSKMESISCLSLIHGS